MIVNLERDVDIPSRRHQWPTTPPPPKASAQVVIDNLEAFLVEDVMDNAMETSDTTVNAVVGGLGLVL